MQAAQSAINPERFERVQAASLQHGNHSPNDNLNMCVMGER